MNLAEQAVAQIATAPTNAAPRQTLRQVLIARTTAEWARRAAGQLSNLSDLLSQSKDFEDEAAMHAIDGLIPTVIAVHERAKAIVAADHAARVASGELQPVMRNVGRFEPDDFGRGGD